VSFWPPCAHMPQQVAPIISTEQDYDSAESSLTASKLEVLHLAFR
jgi:hypothetical protein